MRATGTLVPAFADDLAVFRDDAADARIGLRGCRARSASSSARAMAWRSKSENVVIAGIVYLSVGCLGFRGQQRQLLAIGDLVAGRLPAAGVLAQLVDLVAEGIDVLEVTIHRSEAHECDFVEMAKLLHHELSDGAGRRSRAPPSERILCRMRPTASSIASVPTGLFSSAFSMPARSFSSSKGWRLRSFFTTCGMTSYGRLEGGEALAALQALPAAAHLAAFARQARIGHLGVFVAAEGAVHARSSRSVHGESFAQLERLAAHFLDDGFRPFRIEHVGDEVGDELDFRFLEAARGRCGACPDAGRS